MRNVIGLLLLLIFGMQYSLAAPLVDNCVTYTRIDDMQLTDKQAGLVKQILCERREKQRNLMRETRPKIDAINNEAREQLAAILNADQLSRYDEIRKDRRKKGKEWRTRHFW